MDLTHLLLSKLFPGTQIHTIDLPNNDNDLRNTYEEKIVLKTFKNKSNGRQFALTTLSILKNILKKKKYCLISINLK